jgi:hypothetical protein
MDAKMTQAAADYAERLEDDIDIAHLDPQAAFHRLAGFVYQMAGR